ncbi:hypothetical protein RFI_14150 [Reticulomyxa filosa]|uniref:Uncharacterized protein n=1 Tax=Reticulomyxa filosa TaxID=46433 RepID=X6NB94_RETFI|nr:hypothetical protein RFI_14150 [Reticulomyxa filosa]|eukprot:ETO23034.1 hypothetical protein RFI_14150 [Reticulomyxa filosa]
MALKQKDFEKLVRDKYGKEKNTQEAFKAIAAAYAGGEEELQDVLTLPDTQLEKILLSDVSEYPKIQEEFGIDPTVLCCALHELVHSYMAPLTEGLYWKFDKFGESITKAEKAKQAKKPK